MRLGNAPSASTPVHVRARTRTRTHTNLPLPPPSPPSHLIVTSSQDNQIHTEGAKSLARALKPNQALTSLNLRLNRMGDEGCKVICEALRTNTTLERLNLAANSAGPVRMGGVPRMEHIKGERGWCSSCLCFGCIRDALG